MIGPRPLGPQRVARGTIGAPGHTPVRTAHGPSSAVVARGAGGGVRAVDLLAVSLRSTPTVEGSVPASRLGSPQSSGCTWLRPAGLSCPSPPRAWVIGQATGPTPSSSGATGGSLGRLAGVIH